MASQERLCTPDNGCWYNYCPGSDSNLLGTWGADENNIWVVGTGGVILYWDGKHWTRSQRHRDPACAQHEQDVLAQGVRLSFGSSFMACHFPSRAEKKMSVCASCFRGSVHNNTSCD